MRANSQADGRRKATDESPETQPSNAARGDWHERPQSNLQGRHLLVCNVVKPKDLNRYKDVGSSVFGISESANLLDDQRILARRPIGHFLSPCMEEKQPCLPPMSGVSHVNYSER